ncbi:MAG: sugar isomerase, partial [Lachnospiraceae bacterium]|nr:sugar isomerase [Lachnospiraceae bacterium]
MAKSRTKKASLNIVTSTIMEVTTMLSGLILPRYILRYFGSSYNGITSSASQFLSMISVLTLGVTASTRVALYKTLAKNDVAATSAVVRATERYMRKVALVLGIYLIGLAFIYPLLVKTGFSYLDVSLLILIIGISSFAEYYFGITYRTFLLADQSVYISNIFSCIAIILNLLVSVVLIKAGFGIHIVKLGSSIVFLLRPLLQNIYVTKKYKIDKHCE